MLRPVCLVFLTFISLVPAFSQGEENSLNGVPFSERIVFGGGVGLGFSNVQDYVMLSPSIGYMLTKKLVAGTGVTYRYTNYKAVNPSVSFNDYGVNPFLRYFVYRNIFLHTEYEYLNYEFLVYNERTRRGFDSFLAGGGFIQPLGGKVYFFVMALYNFSYEGSA